jgi:two-component system sensor histidine kinase/response regulator
MPYNSTILIIDDSEISLNILERILNACGYLNVLKAIDAWSGIEIIDNLESTGERLPDLVLMDIVMPELNGIEAMRRLKSHPIYNEIPVILISVKNDPKTLIEAFTAGAADFIHKPVSKPVLQARVEAIIKLKLASDHRKKYETELKNLNQLKNRFIGTAAHDLRGPLASVRGFAEMLIDELGNTANEEQVEMLRMIHEVSHGMLLLVNDLLDFAVIESGKMTLLKESHEIKKVIERRLSVNSYLSAKKNIHINAQLEDLGFIDVDKNRLNQVLDNLLSNAVKFSPMGSEITVRLYRQDGFAVVSIEDQGVGLAPEEISKLFGEYSTASSKATAGETSTGLGLYIVRSILDAHGGTVEIKSVQGKGTEVIFKLPTEATNERSTESDNSR